MVNVVNRKVNVNRMVNTMVEVIFHIATYTKDILQYSVVNRIANVVNIINAYLVHHRSIYFPNNAHRGQKQPVSYDENFKLNVLLGKSLKKKC